jgi:hypothetical protein
VKCVHFAQSARKNGIHILDAFEEAQKIEKKRKAVASFRRGDRVLVDCGKFWGGEPHGTHLVEAILAQFMDDFGNVKSFWTFNLVNETKMGDGTIVGPGDALSTYVDDITPLNP